MNKKSLFILCILIVIALLPKLISIIVNNNSPFGLNFYSISALISYLIYIIVFAKCYKFIVMDDKSNESLLKNLFDISLILLLNSLLVVATESIKAFYFYKMSFSDLGEAEFLNLISMSVFTETSILGYLAISSSFFFVIYIFRSKMNSNK